MVWSEMEKDLTPRDERNFRVKILGWRSSGCVYCTWNANGKWICERERHLETSCVSGMCVPECVCVTVYGRWVRLLVRMRLRSCQVCAMIRIALIENKPIPGIKKIKLCICQVSERGTDAQMKPSMIGGTVAQWRKYMI
jgi:hypothetical protein